MKHTWIFALLGIVGGLVLFLDGIGQAFTFQENVMFKILEVILGIAVIGYIIIKGFR